MTNHLHVLLCIARDPSIRLRDVATLVGITERAAQSIVADLVQAGYVSRVRVGRRNQYDVHEGLPLRHPLERHRSVSDLLQFLDEPLHPGSTGPAGSNGGPVQQRASRPVAPRPPRH